MKAPKYTQPMLLLVDIGNSRLKWWSCPAKPGNFEEEMRWSASMTLVTREAKGKKTETHVKFPETWGEMETAKVTATSIRKLARDYSWHKVVLSSVVPKLIAHFQRAFGDRLHLVSAGSPSLGVPFHYPKPSEVGTDRLAAAAAVREEAVGSAIIVQCGTATAFSVLDAKGRFCGGVIAPGPQTQLAALLGATAKLPAISYRDSSRALGRSTEEAIQNGITLSFRGGVNETLRQMIDQNIASPDRIILTGGNAWLLENHLAYPFTLRPLLVFEGLRIIGNRASAETL